MFPITRRYCENLELVIEAVVRLKKELQRKDSSFSNGGNADEIIELLARANQTKELLESKAASLFMTGAGNSDIVGKYNAVLDSLTGLLTWAGANLPTNGPYLLLYSLDVNFKVQPREFEAGALAPLRTQIQNVLATIE
jgi:hypothetical protein